MSELKSEPKIIQVPAEKVHAFFSDMNHLQTIMPPQVVEWKSSAEHCSFRISGLAAIALKAGQHRAVDYIEYNGSEKMPFPFRFMILIARENSAASRVTLQFDADMNPMMKMLVEKPLGNFIKLLAEKLPLLEGIIP